MPSDHQRAAPRAAIYARYSSDNQREASIEDQVEVCRRYAEVQGWEIVEVYPDRALSVPAGSDLPSSGCRWMRKRAGST